ncbi:UNVERIFIED_CONTAM: hypothetical protein H355_007293 [Colinus virginianus]|nr:hypothetical protein H355_007293 [Colinus virginianus]
MPSSPLRVAVVCSSNQNRSMEAHNILSKRGFSVRSFGTGTHVKLPGPAPDKPNVYDFKTTYDQMYNDLLRKDKELGPLMLPANYSVLIQNSFVACAHVYLLKESMLILSQVVHYPHGAVDHFRSAKTVPDKGHAKSCCLKIEIVFSSDSLTVKVLNSSNFRYTQNGILHMLDRNKRIKPRPERFQNCKDVFDLILTCEERVYDQVVEDLNSREQETCQPVHVINVDIQDNHEEATLGAFLICELCQCIQHTEDMENEIDELLQEFEEKSGRTFLHTVCFY